MRNIARFFVNICFFILGNLLASTYYNRKHLKGKHFQKHLFGIGAPGWEWVCFSFPFQALLRINSKAPWPVTPKSKVTNAENILFSPDDLNNFQSPGCYFQASDSKIIIGKGTYIAPNVGIITSNHDIYDPDFHSPSKDVVLGEKCWIGMNSVILPGVVLGPHTSVGAGSVVTHSFEAGHCVIAGAPAKIIRKLDIDQ